jgi:hypothetical protein
MSGEAQIQISLQINKNDDAGIVQHRSYPTQFTTDVNGAVGPTPGAVKVSVYGTGISFSELSVPSLCRLTNQDADNYVSYGVYDLDTDVFYPLGELLPGEFFLLRLSRKLGWSQSMAGTGTGTVGTQDKQLYLLAHEDTCVVLVEAFEA